MEGLPRCSVGELLGLLKILLDEDGRIDLHKLYTEEHLSLDQMVNIIKTAELLGFVKVENGDLVLTEIGRKMVEEDLQDRKEILRERLLELPIFKKILSALSASPDGCIDREDFESLVSSDLTDDEVKLVVKNILDWGRFAELFIYDGEDDTVCLEREEDEEI